MTRPRLLLAETLDPDGAMVRWLSPDVADLGWDVLRVPAQEAVHYLGRGGERQLWREAARCFRPHVVVVHPPYDCVDDALARDLRAGGSQLVAVVCDDAIFGPRLRQGGRFADYAAMLARRYNLVAVADAGEAQTLRAAGVAQAVFLRWACSAAPFVEAAPLPPALAAQVAGGAVLIGRAYPPRQALVARLAEAGVAVSVFGLGWDDDAVRARLPDSVRSHTMVTREAMVALYRAAGVVITTGDWEHPDVRMIKIRLLEAALSGGFQIAQDTPDLRRYFSPDEVPAYRDPAALVAQISRFLEDPSARASCAQRAHARALAEHTWTTRWPALLAHLDSAAGPWNTLPMSQRCPAWEVALAGLAHAQEARGALRLARETFALWRSRAPQDVSALTGLARTAWALGDAATAATAAHAALETLDARAPIPMAQFPRGPRPAGLGQQGWLDPRPELWAVWLAATMAQDDVAGCLAALDGLTEPDLVLAVAALLADDGVADHVVVWRKLFDAALTAEPNENADVKAAHETRWASASEAGASGALVDR